MSKTISPGRSVWIAIWVLAIFVTLIGGSSETLNWKEYIQLPGSFLVLYLGWFMGPFGILFEMPLVVRILTVVTNVIAYYAFVKMIFFFRGKLKTGR